MDNYLINNKLNVILVQLELFIIIKLNNVKFVLIIHFKIMKDKLTANHAIYLDIRLLTENHVNLVLKDNILIKITKFVFNVLQENTKMNMDKYIAKNAIKDGK
jgi:hypothetical protein